MLENSLEKLRNVELACGGLAYVSLEFQKDRGGNWQR